MATDYAKFLINTKSVERTLSLIQWETEDGKFEVFGMLFESMSDDDKGVFVVSKFRNQWRDYYRFKDYTGEHEQLLSDDDDIVEEMLYRLWARQTPEYIAVSLRKHMGFEEVFSV